MQDLNMRILYLQSLFARAESNILNIKLLRYPYVSRLTHNYSDVGSSLNTSQMKMTIESESMVILKIGNQRESRSMQTCTIVLIK